MSLRSLLGRLLLFNARNEKKLAGICVLAFSLLPIVMWSHHDQAYPIADSAYYAIDSQNIYRQSVGNPISFAAAYAWTGWRFKPILHPLIGSFFFAIFEGDVRMAIWAFQVFHMALFSLAIWLIALLYWRLPFASAGTLITVWSPWVFVSSQSFLPELPFLAYSFSALYFFLKYLRAKSNCDLILFHCFLVISVLVRPVESVFVFLPFVWALLVAKAERVSRVLLVCHLAAATAVLGIPFVLLARNYSITETSAILAISFLFLCGQFLYFFRAKQVFPSCFAAAIAICFAFFLPNSLSLADWIYSCSFGELERIYSIQPELGESNYFYRVLYKLQSFGFLGGGLFALCGLFFFLSRGLTREFTLMPWKLISISIGLLLAISSVSPSSDNRYLVINYTLGIFLGLSFIFSLRMTGVLKNFRLTMILGIIVFLGMGQIAWTTSTFERIGRVYAAGISSPAPLRVPRRDDPVSRVVRQLSFHIESGAGVLFAYHSPYSDYFFGPAALKLAAAELGLFWRTSDINHISVVRRFEKVKESVSYILLEMLEDGESQGSRPGPGGEIFVKMQNAAKASETILEPPFVRIQKFEVKIDSKVTNFELFKKLH